VVSEGLAVTDFFEVCRCATADDDYTVVELNWLSEVCRVPAFVKRSDEIKTLCSKACHEETSGPDVVRCEGVAIAVALNAQLAGSFDGHLGYAVSGVAHENQATQNETQAQAYF
jgi:hypothetical protein